MQRMENSLTSITLCGAEGPGSIAVAATLTLLGIPYTLVEMPVRSGTPLPSAFRL